MKTVIVFLICAFIFLLMLLSFILGAFYGGIREIKPESPVSIPRLSRKNQRLKTGMYFEKPDWTTDEQQDALEYETEQKILKQIKEEEEPEGL